MRAGVPAAVLDLARAARQVCVLTGAGMSAESGVPTFRDAQTGLWERFDPTELATPQAWARDPAQVWAWYVWRFGLVHDVEPNAGHRALAQWQSSLADAGGRLDIVTQNVDDLHERAGAQVLAHVHGSIAQFRCATCEKPWAGEMPRVAEPVASLEPPRCAACGGLVRPGVVWFGEMLPEAPFARAVEAVEAADLVLVVGTSGLVYPAAGLPALALEQGTPVVEINPAASDLSGAVDIHWQTTAATGLPALQQALARAGD